MIFSERLPPEFRTNALADLLSEKARAGEPILDLTESNPTRAGIEYPPGFLNALADPRAAVYEPQPFGMRAAREAIGREYDRDAARVILTASTSEAYSWLFKLFCDPGDEVLVPRPSYPLFGYLAGLESVSARHYGLFYDHGWFIDFHALRRAVTARTRAIVLVNPNNPTGHFLARHEAGELASLGLPIISDEVFRDYPLDPAPGSMRTLAEIEDAPVFTLNGLSKAAGLPQLKLAWIVANRAASDAQAFARLELIADTYLSAGAPVQCALPELLKLRGPVQRQIADRTRANLRLLQASGLRVLNVEAGWYAVVPHDEDAALPLLRDHNVLVQPGYFYDFEKPGYLVLSLLTPQERFQEGVRRLQRV